MKTNSPLSFFCRSAVLWVAIFGLMAGIYFAVDPMSLFRWRKDIIPEFYCPNVGVVSVAEFEHFNPEKHFDSFLIGSSLAIYFSLDHWGKYLPDGASPFNFNLSAMDTRELMLSVEYLLRHAELRNVLIVWETQSFDWMDMADVPYRTPPQLEKDLSKSLDTHYRFFSSWYGRPFINGWLVKAKCGFRAKGDVKFPKFMQIENFSPERNEASQPVADSLRAALSDSFLLANPRLADENVKYVYSTLSSDKIDPRQEACLMRTAAILDSLGTDYYFVLVPSNKNMVLSPHDDNVLRKAFGDRYILTHPDMTYAVRNPYNYYDDGYHMRTVFTDKIVDYVYGVRAPEIKKQNKELVCPSRH